MYWLNYLDRNAIALARLNDLEEDLNLTSTRENWPMIPTSLGAPGGFHVADC